MKLIRENVILSTAVATVSSQMFATGATASAIVHREGLGARVDDSELEAWCREAIATNPKSLADFKSGKDSAINGFKGSVMRAAKGKARPEGGGRDPAAAAGADVRSEDRDLLARLGDPI